MSQVLTSKSLSAGQSSSSYTKPRTQHRKLASGNGTKQSPVGRRQRLHPGMLSSQDRATAHYGAVNGLKVTEDGMYLLSAGWFSLS
jgi:DNA excision repair protein ERCC-8